jgi:hypothetical protein
MSAVTIALSVGLALLLNSLITLVVDDNKPAVALLTLGAVVAALIGLAYSL